jgi:paraquat-inducible protein A
MRLDYYIACPHCDLLQRRQPLPPEGLAVCARCGTLLYRHRRNSLDRTLALAVSGIILFIIANSYPFLSLNIEGQVQETRLASGILVFFRQGMPWMGALVLATGIVFPLVELLGLTYVLLPLKFERLSWKTTAVFRLIRSLQPWGMTEVFLLGILVSIVKLAGMATIVPGIALYAFLVLIFIVAATTAALNPEIVWERLTPQK